MGLNLLRVYYPFNSLVSSVRNRQSVPWTMIFCGVDLIMPTSRVVACARESSSGVEAPGTSQGIVSSSAVP